MYDDFHESDLKAIEHLIKKDMARRMGAIQEDRITGPTDRNVGNAAEYVKKARVLRKVLKESGKQGYVPVREFHGGTEWLNDDVMEAAEIGNTSNLASVCEKLHDISHPFLDAGSMTDHQSVPGKPA